MDIIYLHVKQKITSQTVVSSGLINNANGLATI